MRSACASRRAVMNRARWTCTPPAWTATAGSASGEHAAKRGVTDQFRCAVQFHLAHDAQPMVLHRLLADVQHLRDLARRPALGDQLEHLAFARGEPFIGIDRKSTRLNSSHVKISYAV